MSSQQLHHSYSLPRPARASQQAIPQQATPSQPSFYPNPYSTTNATYHTYPAWNRQSTIASGFPFPPQMPGYSSLNNMDLVDALLTPSRNEHEQEHHRRGFSTSSPFRELQTPIAKRVRSTVDEAFGEVAELSEQDRHVKSHKQSRSSSDKRPRKQQKRKSIAPSELDDEYLDHALADDVDDSPRARKPRRSTRSKKSPVVDNLAIPEDNGRSSPKKEEKPKKQTPAKKTPKPRTGRLIRKKPIGMSVPKSLSEAGPPDRMMWEWKNQGRNWEEIRAEWKRMTGVEPGGSSLSVRYIKLVENLARNGAAGDIELLRFKKEAEEDLLSQLWPKVAEKMLSYSPESEYNPKDLQKRYNMIVRSGYDVEQLLADDKVKREAELKGKPSAVKHDGNDEDFDFNADDIHGYNDSVARGSPARLQGHEFHDIENRDLQSQYSGDYLPVSEAPLKIFEPVTVNHEGGRSVIERSFHNCEYGAHGDEEAGNPMSSATALSTSPFIHRKQAQTPAKEPCLPLANALVGYNSDSA